MYEIYEKLRDINGLTNYKVAKDTGLSQMTLSDWKLGKSSPSAKTLKKLADYFDVPLEYLTTGEMPNYYTNEETAKLAQEIYENRDLRILFNTAKDATPEDLKFLAEMAKKFKGTNNG